MSDQTVAVNSECHPDEVADVLSGLRERTAAALPDEPLRVELTEGRATALALQLAASAALSLKRRSAFAGYGPHAAAALSQHES